MPRVIPNFFIVGAAKSGTTSLYKHLNEHPDIWMPAVKEPHFFGEHRPPGLRYSSKQDYLNLFGEVDGQPAVGEASTAYLYSKTASTEIAEFNPQAKIIVVLRNPVARAYSLYWHNVRAGVEPESFEKALVLEEERVGNGWRYGFHYVTSGMYAEQIQRYLSVFPSTQIKIVLFEELHFSVLGVVRELFSFLGVSPDQHIQPQRIFNRSGPPKHPLLNAFLHKQSRVKRMIMSPLPVGLKKRWKSRLLEANSATPPKMQIAVEQQLVVAFEEDVARLALLIDRDLSNWLIPSP